MEKTIIVPEIYLYGMTVYSTIHLLNGPYPEADSYAEIKESHQIPGGETGNSAIVLAKLGYRVKIDGPFLGSKTKDGIHSFFEKIGVDCSALNYDSSFDGVQDMVLIDGSSRTVFGKFQHFFNSEKRWNKPDQSAIKAAGIVSLDPFFGRESEEVARFCAAIKKKYVTIDTPPEGDIHRNAAATVISNEFIRNEYPDINPTDLLKKYTEYSEGLVIFTFGSREILFSRKGQPIRRFSPYQVAVKSTLGAGDTFRAGVVYGILNGWEDSEVVKFAAATAASVCARFPMALDPPGLDEILSLMRK